MKRILILISLGLFIVACSYEEQTTSVEEEESFPAAVQIQVVGSTVEGLTVCFDTNNTCKKTNTNGVVEYESFGDYRFMIRDINITTLTIDNNRTIVSPYKLFDANETMAKRFLMLLHAFSKSSDPTDEAVLLTLSDYIPVEKSIEELLDKTAIDSNTTHETLKYTINEHNVSIDFDESNITRDDKTYNLSIPSKKAYQALETVKNFVDFAVDKNVSLDNFEDKFLFVKQSLTTFSLGDKYTVTTIVKEDEVFLDFLDNESRTTDRTTLIETNNSKVLTTSLLSLRINSDE
ncbi:MAG: Unknown protein [uncultured Sulfurovum sp.]|uniref:Uncharacterized protein n=1 Tax=uncultured Sulfurovum sp. TaxID=269237 RepID=A0A6S6TIG8_9BACT|nr:MAG: Unknown protein [uncultured Sulfurovum sp.]